MNIAAKTSENTGKFEGNISTAINNDMLGPARQVQRFLLGAGSQARGPGG